MNDIAVHLPSMFAGLGRTLLVSVLGIAISLILGVVLGGIRYARVPVLSQLIDAVATFIRCTPLIVQIFMIFYGLPEVGITLSPFSAAVISLAIWGAAYQIETFRAGFEAVPVGDVTAARALGMTLIGTFRSVTLPLGLRTALPSVTTVTISQFRSSAFMVAIGYAELTAVANRIVSNTFQVFEVFGVAALMYLVVSTLISAGSRLAERRLATATAGGV